ncbi:CS1-pili formation C-terminal domain-containing protein [Chromobacterium haemolyticum]|uniref:CS1-pili formation C-terminal domain-containing protein n=1 Tax=Chromobacterium haemolyticum TaxID=394935 RepID=UPI00307F8703
MPNHFRLPLAAILVGGLFSQTKASELDHRAPLLAQVESLPAEFRDHVFDVPLAARVELDGKLLGDAMVLLSRQGTVQLLRFTDDGDSQSVPADRQRWAQALLQPLPQGQCTAVCPPGLLALHYSLENSQLTLLTQEAGQDGQRARFHALPPQGSHGLILNNQLNLVGGGGQPLSGRYALDLQGSLGHWNALGSVQLDRGDGGQLNRTLPHLYLQRENEGHFIRAGLFSPSGQGLLRQPRTEGDRAYTTIGLMAGSSDTLLASGKRPSLYPVYVTANRESTVEVYRNGALIHSQLVQAGLQLVNTEALPGGIYPVEVRVMEDGRQVASQEELIYKPSQWANPEQRWRYSAYAGQQRGLGSDSNPQAGDWAFGGSLNYLLHPRATVGMAAQQIGNQRQFGASLDWDPADAWKLYANVFHTAGYGNGFDAQAIWRYGQGSVVFNHSRSWRENEDGDVALSARSAMSINHALNDKTTLNARLSRSHAQGGVNVDLGLDKHGKLMGHDANWRLALFDRADTPGRRSRGVEVGLNLSLGKEGRYYSASLGSRNSAQGRDQYLSASMRQNFEQGWLQSAGATVNADRQGLGLSGSAQFQHDLFRGDAFAQRGAGGQGFNGGLNLESTLAIGGGKAVASGDSQASFAHTGVIVDVDSELDAVPLQANDSHGGSAPLRPGRNFIPVAAYKPGQLQFDFAGAAAPAVTIQPASHAYHLNKGGVAHIQVKALKTVTVLGQLLDASGQPLRGAQVINHASRSVSEADGFFSIEMSESTPTLEVRHHAAAACQFRLDAGQHRREADTLLVGTLRCTASPETAA